jgi:hypothetical protein
MNVGRNSILNISSMDMPQMEEELLTLAENQSSSHGFIEVFLAPSLAFC